MPGRTWNIGSGRQQTRAASCPQEDRVSTASFAAHS